MLVMFPLGLFGFSFVADLFFLGTGDFLWSDVAYYTMAGGIVGGVLAAIPGAMDLFAMPYSRTRAVGVVHMSINLAVVILYALNLWMRGGADAQAMAPIWLSAVSVALLAVSGWLGGEMVYVHRAGVCEERTPPAQAAARKQAHTPSRR